MEYAFGYSNLPRWLERLKASAPAAGKRILIDGQQRVSPRARHWRGRLEQTPGKDPGTIRCKEG